MSGSHLITRRLLGTTALATALTASTARAQTVETQTAAVRPSSLPGNIETQFTVNGEHHSLSLDPRTTLLDALRDHIGLSGTKKGCDHGQCGACTVLVNGLRLNSCLSLAAARDGDKIVTIEGLAPKDETGAEKLHPMQAAFVHADAFQCGFCTPGQICSAIGMVSEIKRGVPSAVALDFDTKPIGGNVEEVRERMSGNICRCAAYPNIVAAIISASEVTPK